MPKGSQQGLFPYVFPDIRDWPLYKLYQDRSVFIDEVCNESVDNILYDKDNDKLNSEIASVLYQERSRIKLTPWRVDSADEEVFWRGVKKSLVSKSLDDAPDEQAEANNKDLVEQIARRYTEEIAGNFEISTYRFARTALTNLFGIMLRPFTIGFLSKYLVGTPNLNEKIQVLGDLATIRELSKKGTVVVVPTHFSNLDSILIGWCVDRIGLPALSYGAGLNLYNTRIFGYFFGRLGAYTVDRRKKNSFYLATLKAFSRISIFRGTHTLFFPGGTRARSGELESKLKMGLLGTVVDAQCDNYTTDKKEKIFIVPLVLNYHFVLEAKGLIEQFLANTGKELYLVDNRNFGGTKNLIKFLWQFFYKSSEIVVNFGKPMDVLGNMVDVNGQSFNSKGEPIDLADYFKKQGGEVNFDRQRNEQYTQKLANHIVDRFHKENVVLTSHLVAFAAFNWLEVFYNQLDLYGILRLSKEECVIPAAVFKLAVAHLLKQLFVLEAEGKVQLSKHLKEDSLEAIIENGLANLGAFHPQKPLIKNPKTGDIETQDINLLFYYQNRLEGYKLNLKKLKINH